MGILAKNIPCFCHFLFVEMKGWFLATYIMWDTIKKASLGDCKVCTEEEKLLPNNSCSDVEFCGWSYVLDDNNYTESISPKMYVGIVSIALLFPVVVGIITLGKESILMQPFCSGKYLKVSQSFLESKFFKYYGYFAIAFIMILAVVGHLSAHGGTPQTEPLNYYFLIAVGLQQLASTVFAKHNSFIDFNEEFIQMQFERKFKHLLKQQTNHSFLEDLCLAKQTENEAVIKLVFKVATEEQLRMLRKVKIDSHNGEEFEEKRASVSMTTINAKSITVVKE